MDGNGKQSVRSTRGAVSGYGKGRTRRWRWSVRIWRDGAKQSEQLRRQGFATEQDATDDMERVLGAIRERRSTTAAPTREMITLGAAFDRLLIEKARKKTIKEYRRIANRLKQAFGAHVEHGLELAGPYPLLHSAGAVGVGVPAGVDARQPKASDPRLRGHTVRVRPTLPGRRKRYSSDTSPATTARADAHQ